MAVETGPFRFHVDFSQGVALIGNQEDVVTSCIVQSHAQTAAGAAIYSTPAPTLQLSVASGRAQQNYSACGRWKEGNGSSRGICPNVQMR